MKRIISFLVACILTITVVGCGEQSHEGEAKTPSASSAQEGRAYRDVINDFEEKGFTNIKTVVLEDLVTGWLVQDGEVDSVSVDGDEDYTPDTWYPKDVEVVVKYHTFPEEEETAEQSTDESYEQNNQEAGDAILTVENNADLAALFADGENEELCKKFVDKYKGKTIEFDGNIALVSPHGDYDTRYDFLVYAGDYSESSSYGPAMQFEDKNFLDLNLTGDTIPDAIKAGDNLHIVATIEDIVNNYLIILDPVSMEIR